MAFGWTVRVDEIDGGARVTARDWPWAVWCAIGFGLLGLPLLIWSVAERHLVEAGGGVVFCGHAAFGAWLALGGRRQIELRRTATGVSLQGTEGSWPLKSRVDLRLNGDADISVVSLPGVEEVRVPEHAGADLILRVGGERHRLARRMGRRRKELEEARDRLADALGLPRGAPT